MTHLKIILKFEKKNLDYYLNKEIIVAAIYLSLSEEI